LNHIPENELCTLQGFSGFLIKEEKTIWMCSLVDFEQSIRVLTALGVLDTTKNLLKRIV